MRKRSAALRSPTAAEQLQYELDVALVRREGAASPTRRVRRPIQQPSYTDAELFAQFRDAERARFGSASSADGVSEDADAESLQQESGGGEMGDISADGADVDDVSEHGQADQQADDMLDALHELLAAPQQLQQPEVQEANIWDDVHPCSEAASDVAGVDTEGKRQQNQKRDEATLGRRFRLLLEEEACSEETCSICARPAAAVMCKQCGPLHTYLCAECDLQLHCQPTFHDRFELALYKKPSRSGTRSSSLLMAMQRGQGLVR